jgi:DNA polymerase-3 subunit alpha
MLADVREKLIRSVDLVVDINRVNRELIEEIDRFTVSENGKLLRFKIHDPESQLQVNLFSRKKQVALTDEFIDFLKDNPAFEFRLT